MANNIISIAKENVSTVELVCATQLKIVVEILHYSKLLSKGLSRHVQYGFEMSSIEQ